ncbi:MAG: hypothetical protein ACRDJN_31385 [Chloroflexota bacterium]
MRTKERPGLREVLPGLYESTDLPKEVQLTEEDAAAVERYSGSKVLRRLIEEAIRKQQYRKTAIA